MSPAPGNSPPLALVASALLSPAVTPFYFGPVGCCFMMDRLDSVLALLVLKAPGTRTTFPPPSYLPKCEALADAC